MQIRSFDPISQFPLSLFQRNKNICLLFLALFAGVSVYGQDVLPLNNSYLTSGMHPVSELSDYWRDADGRSYNVPFFDPEKEKLNVTQIFFLDSLKKLKEPLFLYFGGVSCEAEVFLNGRMIGVIETPFAEFIYPITHDLLVAGRNELKVKLIRKGNLREWFPKSFAGIINEVALLEQDGISRIPELPELVNDAQKVLVYAAWTQKDNYKPDPARFWTDLMEIKTKEFDAIWFPFRPHGKYLVMVKKAGLKLASGMQNAREIALFNEFPFEKLPGNIGLAFWKSKNGLKTEAFGTFQTLSPDTRQWTKMPLQPALIVILVIPLLGILLMKLLAPRTYSSMVEFLTKSKIYIDLIAKRKFLKTPEMVLLNLFRMILVSVMISVPLYYVQCSGKFELLNLFSTQSILYKQFLGSSLSLAEYFGISLMFVVGINSVKYAVTYFLGLIYRVQGFSSDAQNLDVFLYFPLSFGLLVPVAFLFFIKVEALNWVVGIWVIIFIAITIRRLWLNFTGLGTLFGLRTSLKILYICAFEILPWIILI